MFIHMYAYVRLCLSDKKTESYAGAAPFVQVAEDLWTASIARNKVHRGNRDGLAAPGMKEAYALHGDLIVTTAVSARDAFQMEGLLAFVYATHKSIRAGGLNRFILLLLMVVCFYLCAQNNLITCQNADGDFVEANAALA
jgi:hypothetical protein